MLKIAWITQAGRAVHGYGRVALKMRMALERQGAEIVGDRHFGWDWRIILGQPAASYVAGVDLAEDLCYHNMFEAMPLPADFAPVLNRAGVIWSPSEWCKQLFIDGGITRPIFVVGYGVDQDEYTFLPRERANEDPYTFLVMTNMLISRKGALRAIRAFARLQEQLPGVAMRLIVKLNAGVIGAPKVEDMAFDDQFPNTRSGPMAVTYHGRPVEDVYTVYGDMSTFELAHLFGLADCFVYPTSGEGFGLQPLEAMATGLPVITTDWSGQTEYLKDNVALTIPVVGMERAFTLEQIYGCDCWQGVPDEGKLLEHMRWCVENRGEAARMGEQAAEYVASTWTWDGAARKVLEQLCLHRR